jgi:hypothetical protein
MPLASQLSNFFFAGSSAPASSGDSRSDEHVVGLAEPPRNALFQTNDFPDRSSITVIDSGHTMKSEDIETKGRPPFLHVRSHIQQS